MSTLLQCDFLDADRQPPIVVGTDHYLRFINRAFTDEQHAGAVFICGFAIRGGNGTNVFQLTSSDGEIDVNDFTIPGQEGTVKGITIHIPASKTADLNPDSTYEFDVIATVDGLDMAYLPLSSIRTVRRITE
jgi:hypothetical protein